MYLLIVRSISSVLIPSISSVIILENSWRRSGDSLDRSPNASNSDIPQIGRADQTEGVGTVMCSTMGERYPVVFEWQMVRRADDADGEQMCGALAGVSGEAVTITEGVIAYADGPAASASTLVVRASRDAHCNGATVGGCTFAAANIYRGTTWFHKRVAMEPVLPWHLQTPFGPRPYPWT